MLRGWQEKGDWLRQVRDFQLFNREADHLEAATSAQAKFLNTIGWCKLCINRLDLCILHSQIDKYYRDRLKGCR